MKYLSRLSVLVVNLSFLLISVNTKAQLYIQQFLPTTAKKGASVTLYGSGFTGATTVSFGGVQVDSFKVIDNGSIIAILDTAASGEINVTTPGGVAKLGGFTFIDSACPVPVSTSTVVVSVCDKAFPFTWGIITYPGPGTYIVQSRDMYGCDSIFTLQLNSSGPCTWNQLGPDTLKPRSIIFTVIADSANNIYAAGDIPDGNGKYCVAKWNGIQWSALGGTSLAANNTIKTLCMDRKGNIYAAGSFRNTNGRGYVAKWDGNNWSELSGLDTFKIFGSIRSLCLDNGGNIYAACWGRNTSNNCFVAKWDGTSWSELGGVNALAANDLPWTVCTDKAGNVYTGGLFTNAGGNIYVAKWDGTQWSELGGNNSFAAFIDPNRILKEETGVVYICTDKADNIYVAGDFSDTSGYRYIAKWDGTQWSELGGVNSLKANSLEQAVIADSSGNIYTAGYFMDSNGTQYVAKWNGTRWSEVGGLSGLSANSTIVGIGLDKWGNVYAGGDFTNSNGHRYVARFAEYITVKNGNWNDPASWLGGAVPPANAHVIINNTITVTANAACASLTESIGGSVIVNPNVNLAIGN